MKKYIKPIIKVRKLMSEETILAASGLVEDGDNYTQSVKGNTWSIDKEDDILSKKNLFESWDEE